MTKKTTRKSAKPSRGNSVAGATTTAQIEISPDRLQETAGAIARGLIVGEIAPHDVLGIDRDAIASGWRNAAARLQSGKIDERLISALTVLHGLDPSFAAADVMLGLAHMRAGNEERAARYLGAELENRGRHAAEARELRAWPGQSACRAAGPAARGHLLAARTSSTMTQVPMAAPPTMTAGYEAVSRASIQGSGR
jgi:hypothetical protein